MSAVTIYGASDDLIVIEGDFSEEFSAAYEADTWLVFGDGTILVVRYDDNGVWRITRKSDGRAAMTKIEAPTDDEDNYSDRVTLTGDLHWVLAVEAITWHKIPALSERSAEKP
jgi:hypothetical protein